MLREVHAITSASIAWWRWSIRFLLNPRCSSNGTAVWKTLLPSLFSHCPKASVPVSLFKRSKRGYTILFQTSFNPQSFFNLSVIPPEQDTTNFDVASSSPSARTILESKAFTTLLIYLLSFIWRLRNSCGISSSRRFSLLRLLCA